MKIAYFDCFSGISGDMCLGALADAGIPLESLEQQLKKLGLRGYKLRRRRLRRSGIAATKIDVILQSSGRFRHQHPVTCVDIEGIIDRSGLREEIRRKGKAVFRRIFRAEAKVHGRSINKIHLHELGGIDCLVDVFGTLIGLELLGVDRIYSSPLNIGSGSVVTEHGVLPVPAPATMELLRGTPVYSADIPFELTTPTGAALITTLAAGFGTMPFFTPSRIGIGAGKRDISGRPNVLRIFIGDSGREAANEKIMVIETNIDDMNPQIYEHLLDKLLRQGALDVYLTQVIMKKTRPAVKLTILCHADRRDALLRIVFNETTTIGVRYFEAERVVMDRKIETVSTRYGNVRVKCSGLGSLPLRYTPEYEDCRKLSEKKDIPLIEVIEVSRRRAVELQGKKSAGVIRASK